MAIPVGSKGAQSKGISTSSEPNITTLDVSVPLVGADKRRMLDLGQSKTKAKIGTDAELSCLRFFSK